MRDFFENVQGVLLHNWNKRGGWKKKNNKGVSLFIREMRVLRQRWCNPFKSLVPQIEMYPNSYQYPLINYLDVLQEKICKLKHETKEMLENLK